MLIALLTNDRGVIQFTVKALPADIHADIQWLPASSCARHGITDLLQALLLISRPKRENCAHLHLGLKAFFLREQVWDLLRGGFCVREKVQHLQGNTRN
jgi:hypothetical protein